MGHTLITGTPQPIYAHRKEPTREFLTRPGKGEHLIGEAKEKIGQMTGNENLENAGKRDQLTGETKEAVGMVRQ